MTVRELPASSYPFTVELWAAGADRRGPATWSATVPGPGGLQIPALGHGAWTRVSYGDGDVQIVAPDGADAADF